MTNTSETIPIIKETPFSLLRFRRVTASPEGIGAQDAAASKRVPETLPARPLCAGLLQSAQDLGGVERIPETLPPRPLCAGLLESL